MLNLGFLASGGGSSMAAILQAIQNGGLAADPRLLVSNKRGAGALEIARAHGVATLVAPTLPDPDAADARLRQAMEDAGVEWIVMSGYLRRLGPATLERYADRILNIHPGPLPRFGGEGMYGSRVHEAVIAAGLAITEICIHLVDGEYDHGAVVARRAVEVRADDTPLSLESRIKSLEPCFFVETLSSISDNIP